MKELLSVGDSLELYGTAQTADMVNDLAASEEKSARSDTTQSTAIGPLPQPLASAAGWPPLLLLLMPLVALGPTRVQMMTPSGSGSKLPTPCRKAAGSGTGRKSWVGSGGRRRLAAAAGWCWWPAVAGSIEKQHGCPEAPARAVGKPGHGEYAPGLPESGALMTSSLTLPWYLLSLQGTIQGKLRSG